MTQRMINGCPGLWTAPNSEIAPPGALKRAFGVVVRRPGLLEKMRPLRQYSAASEYTGTFTGTPTNLTQYSSRMVMATSAGKLAVETAAGSGILNVVSTAVSAPSSGTHVFMETNGNLYVTSGAGLYKLDAVAGTPYAAGVPRALDVQLTLVATGTLLANTNSVGYRVVFGLLDANSNLVLGPPSGRATTTATAAQNVTVKAFIPSAITAASNATSYFVQVYRTPVNTVASTDPGEEMQLAYQAFLTSADVANKFISVTDAIPDNLRGAAAYFCPSQEGIANANYLPPLCADAALFKGAAFYANTTQKHRSSLQLTGVSANLLTISTGAGGITKSGGNGVYTFTGTPDLTNIPTDGTAKLSSTGNTSAGNNGEFVITAVNTGAFTITVTNAGAVTEAGTANSRGWPSKLTIAAVNYYGSINGTETVASQIFKVATAGTASQNVVDTCGSLLRVVNQQTSPVVYGYYESGPDDGAGKMSFAAVSLGASSFTIAAGGTLLYNSFNPTIPVAAPLASRNDAAGHRLHYSKQNQPEHVPLISYFDIGTKSKSILRIMALREALLVFKEDGLFRVTGDGAGNFAVSLMDSSVRLSSASYRSFGILNNRVYCHTINGAASISETSVSLIDDPVANLFRLGAESALTATVAVSEYDQLVYFYVQTTGTQFDSVPVYSARSGVWTQAYAAGVSAPVDPYSFSGFVFYTFPGTTIDGKIHRWNPSGDIYKEDVTDSTETSSTGGFKVGYPTPAHKILTNVTLVSGSTITVAQLGSEVTYLKSLVDSSVDVYVRGNNSANGIIYKIASYNGNILTLTSSKFSNIATWPVVSNFANGHASIWVGVSSTVEWVPFTGGDDASYMRVSGVSVTFDALSMLTAATLSAFTEAATSETTIASMTAANTPPPAGFLTTPTLLRSILPGNMQTCRRLSLVLSHSALAEFMFIKGIYYEFTPLGAPAKEIT